LQKLQLFQNIPATLVTGSRSTSATTQVLSTMRRHNFGLKAIVQ